MRKARITSAELTPELFFALLYLVITFSVFVVVPILSTVLDLDELIYPWGVESGALWVNGLSCAIAMLAIKKFNGIGERYKIVKKEQKYIFEEHLLIFLWLALFVYFGGTSYREDDVVGGNRSLELSLVLTVLPIIIILAVKFLFFSQRRLLTGSAALFFLLVFAQSGGRGVLVHIAMVFLFLLISNAKKPIILKRVFLRTTLYSSGLKILSFIVIFLILFGIWGVLRDDTTDLASGLIWRLSEPYWSLAQQTNTGFCDFGIVSDSFQRLTWSILRFDVFNVGGTIEGNTYYLELLGIEKQPGISLPITIIGHGYLMCGTYGAIFAVPMSMLMIFVGIKLCFKLASYLPDDWRLSFKIYFLSKVVLLHSKSFSGLSSYLYYETIRDWMLIVAFLFMCTALRSLIKFRGSYR